MHQSACVACLLFEVHETFVLSPTLTPLPVLLLKDIARFFSWYVSLPKVLGPLISLSSEPCIQESSQGAWRKCLRTSATYLSAGTAGLAVTASFRSTWLYWRAPPLSNCHRPNIQVSFPGTNPATDELGTHKKGGAGGGSRKKSFLALTCGGAFLVLGLVDSAARAFPRTVRTVPTVIQRCLFCYNNVRGSRFDTERAGHR